MAATGSTQAFSNNLTLLGTDLPPGSLTLAITSRTQGLTVMPGTSVGNLCLGGTIGRFVPQATQSDAAGTVNIPIDLTALPQPMGTVAAVPGETWNFQLWFRDSVAGQAVSNFTQGLEISAQ